MPGIKQQLKKKLAKCDTQERCGIILADDSVIELPNHHPEPEKGYQMLAKDRKQYESKMVGTWHTHPHDTANLSQEDYAGFKAWPELTHYIVGVDAVRAFAVVDELVIEVSL